MYSKKYGNSSSTHQKIYRKDIELVQKLDYYMPTEETLFNLNHMDPKNEKKLQTNPLDLTNSITHKFNNSINNPIIFKVM